MTAITGQAKLSMTSVYFWALILPSSTVKVPTPSQVMQPQIIKLARTPRPGYKHGGVHSSPGHRQISTRLSIPKSTLHSSLYITFFQKSFTVVCLFNLHHASHFLTLQSRILMLFVYNTLVIFCVKQVSLNSSIRYKSSPILIENISNFPEWTFSVKFYNPIKFSSVPGVNKDGLPDLSLFSTVPRCLKQFKTLYIVGSGCPVSRAIAGPFSPALCKAAIAFSRDKDR